MGTSEDTEGNTRAKRSCSRSVIVVVILVSLLIGVGLAIGLALYGYYSRDCQDEQTGEQRVEFKSRYGTYEHGAVATDASECSDVGRDILARKGGNAFDAAAAALFCIGAINPHSAGVGGGSLYVIYDKKEGWMSLTSREMAPARAHRDMFTKEEDRPKSKTGGMAIGVPGEVKGLLELQQRYGRIPWSYVVQPTIDLLKNGVPISKSAHAAVKRSIEKLKDKSSYSVFLDADGNAKPAGTIITLPKLAKTMEVIRDDPMSFYTGSLARDIARDIREAGGIITSDDLKSYRVSWSPPVKATVSDHLTLYSIPPPGSGPILAYILSILSGYGMTAEDFKTEEAQVLTLHRAIEAMKFGYAKRASLGDQAFLNLGSLIANLTSPAFGESTRSQITDDTTHGVYYYKPDFHFVDDYGTSHLSVVDSEGNAVSVTSTINLYFGSKVVGKRTGIFFNDQMDDFSTPNTTNAFGVPASESNFIHPGKRPMSSMSPVIVWDNNSQRVTLVTGASGATRITSAVAMVIMNVHMLNMSLPEAVDQARVHHQLVPVGLSTDSFFPQNLKDGLAEKGHTFRKDRGYAVVQAIQVLENSLVAVSDFRKGGEPSGY